MSTLDWMKAHPVRLLGAAATGFVSCATLLGVIAQFGGCRLVSEGSYVERSSLEEKYLLRAEVRERFVARTTYSSCQSTVEQLEGEVEQCRDALVNCQSDLETTRVEPSPGVTLKGSQREIHEEFESDADDKMRSDRPQSETAGAGLTSTLKEDFAFSVDKCTATGSTVTCSAIVNNIASVRRDLAVWTRYYDPVDISNIQGNNRTYAVAVDDLGNRYAPKDIKRFQTSWAINTTLEPDLPIRFRLVYQNVAKEAKNLTIVLGCTVGERESDVFEVVLRNIPIAR